MLTFKRHLDELVHEGIHKILMMDAQFLAEGPGDNSAYFIILIDFFFWKN